MHVWLVLTYDLLEDRGIDNITTNNLCLFMVFNKRFHFAMCSFCNKSQRRSVNISDTPGCALCVTFCSRHILTSSMIYYWTDVHKHGIYVLIWKNIYNLKPVLFVRQITNEMLGVKSSVSTLAMFNGLIGWCYKLSFWPFYRLMSNLKSGVFRYACVTFLKVTFSFVDPNEM